MTNFTSKPLNEIFTNMVEEQIPIESEENIPEGKREITEEPFDQKKLKSLGTVGSDQYNLIKKKKNDYDIKYSSHQSKGKGVEKGEFLDEKNMEIVNTTEIPSIKSSGIHVFSLTDKNKSDNLKKRQIKVKVSYKRDIIVPSELSELNQICKENAEIKSIFHQYWNVEQLRSSQWISAWKAFIKFWKKLGPYITSSTYLLEKESMLNFEKLITHEGWNKLCLEIKEYSEFYISRMNKTKQNDRIHQILGKAAAKAKEKGIKKAVQERLDLSGVI